MNQGWKLAAIIALVGLGAACGAPSEDGVTPGVTDDTIKLGMTADLTGPIAFLGQEISAGAKLYFDQVNRAGGVHGRKIELIVEDDGYQPPRSVAAYRKLVDRDGVFCFMGNLGTATVMAMRPMLERDKIPLVAPTSFASLTYTPPSRYLFGVDPSYRMTSWMLVEYIRDDLGAPDARIGVIYQDDDLGADALTGLHEAASHYGLDIVAEESHKRGAVEFGSQVLNLKKAGATHVLLWTILRESAAILEEAKSLEWSPEFIGWFGFADDRVVELAGDAAKNLHVLSLFDVNSDDASVKEYLEARERHQPDHRAGFYHAGGFSLAQVVVEALERSGRDVTRENLVEALETFDRWDDNAWGHPFTYGPNVRGGSAAKVFFAKADVEKGTLVRITPDRLFEMPDL